MIPMLFVATAIFVIFMGTLKTGKLFNPLFFYIFFLVVWTLVSMTNPFYLFEVSIQTYLMVWLNITFFSLGFIIVSKNIKPTIVSDIVLGGEFLNAKKFLFVQVIVFFILLYFRQQYLEILSNLSITDARRIVYEEGLLFKSSFSNIFYYWVISPTVYCSILILISNLVSNRKINISLFVALINCMLFANIGYGRFIYFNIIIYFLVSTGLKYDLHKKIHFNLKLKSINRWFIYIASLTLVVYFMNKSTAKRLGIPSPNLSESLDIFVNNSLKDFVLYFTGPFRTLDYFFTSKMVETTGYTLGRATFSGVEEIFNNFFIFFAHRSIFAHSANVITSGFTNKNILVGAGTYFNAFYTNTMNFYLDGGIPFLIVISTFYGIVMGMAYRYYRKNTNLFTFSLIVFLTYNMISSEFRWDYSAPSTWIIIFALIYMNNRHIKKSKQI